MAILTATLAALMCGGSLRAHHSNIAIDASRPIWVKGTVVRYEVVNPHTMLEIDEITSDGQVKRWTVDGPIPRRVENMTRFGDYDVDKSFVSEGDVIEVCGFTPKRLLDPVNPNGPRPPIIHGHLLVKANGQRSPWGSYGKMENCVRPGDEPQSWVQFLDANRFARHLWCNYPYRTTVPTIAASIALVDEINRLIASPCS
jgi:hypothetical protein